MPRRKTMVAEFMEEPVAYGGLVVPRHLALRNIELTVRNNLADDGLTQQQMSEKVNQAQFYLLAKGDDPERIATGILGPEAEEILRKENRELEERERARPKEPRPGSMRE